MGSPLEGCVSSLRNSMQLLDSSINILDSGVNDFPRLCKVLQTTRHFELISEPDLHAAQTALLSEIRPEVENLLQRVSNYLDKLERREQSLIAKCDLNEGRLGGDAAGESAFRPSSRTSRAKTPSGEGGRRMTALQELKYKSIRQKKERLSYAVETLEMQAKQRERQLRMSMAAPQQFLDDDDDE
ncbi:DASH complex, subunit Spc19 [Aaosphaeria arxii CBS 175.79]|uniref:DASH complex subunit SPC19 n=1 Tax=Aaosphaeria arxii CBS 175.79 TaxID=1450172 RepID=A0A6A5Y8C9_9PLEO|nr:DASH complex, subunit Spc19 [Aaosphaeria arxii CBS 175.79]KAF2021648.1 DASH complex, subunit Spc19 [Aaosphaeria arxii CBS 175.79]